MLIHSIPKDRKFLFAIVHIENFGELGTIFGYETLDEILQFISGYLQQWSREFNYSLYRLRGNDFGLLIPRDSMARAASEALLNRICAALRREFMAWGRLNIHLNIKLGASFINDASRSISSPRPTWPPRTASSPPGRFPLQGRRERPGFGL